MRYLILLLFLLTGCSKGLDDSHTITYSVEGDGLATISFIENDKGVGLHNRQLPWSITLYGELPEQVQLSAQSSKTMDCRIIVDGKILLRGKGSDLVLKVY